LHEDGLAVERLGGVEAGEIGLEKSLAEYERGLKEQTYLSL
jgi:exonuclease VII small subunit